jgi:RNA polymerase sigma-70 factor (ECF subfamily)
VLGSAHTDVEDTLQEAMVAVHLAIPAFRGECTTLHFACRIAVQTAMNARRRAGYRTRLTPSAAPADLVDFASDDRSPAENMVVDQRREALRQLLHELPDIQAEVLALHMLLGYTVEETAAATATPVNTVRSRLRSALSKLRARVQGDGALLEAIRGGT